MSWIAVVWVLVLLAGFVNLITDVRAGEGKTWSAQEVFFKDMSLCLAAATALSLLLAN